MNHGVSSPSPGRALACLASSWLVLSWHAPALADPRDDEIFGAEGGAESSASAPEPEPEPTHPPATPTKVEPSAPTRAVTLDDPLRIGGQYYQRAYTTLVRGQRVGDMTLGTPMLLDLYLDARPSDRVRSFVLGRLAYDPTLPTNVSATPNGSAGQFNGVEIGGRPQGSLDQLWLNFDIARRLFVTVGKQHVRWGTAQIWTPTDFLHLHPRNPLDQFDARAGRTMLKLHFPIESRAWNFYAYALTENERATTSLERIGVAARAEITLGTTEGAVGVVARQGEHPKFAADVSSGIGAFDVYGELAVLDSGTADRTRRETDPIIPAAPAALPGENADQIAAKHFAQAVDAVYPTYREWGYRVQAVAGAGYSLRYSDSDTLELGAEYFYNQLGYSNSKAYPGLFLPRDVPLHNAASFFYLGRHYGALFARLPAPGSLNLHSFSLTTLGNFSDRSFLTRLDYSLTLLTHISFEAFTSFRYGKRTGEFRFGVDPVDLDGTTIRLPPTVADLGIGLRLSI